MTDARPEVADVIVIGGGIAGAGAAFELAKTLRVVLLEREDRCGYHSTGRSAASFTENYGTGVIRRLVLASRDFLTAPPENFSAYPILGPRGMITVARADQADLIEAELVRAQALVPSITAMSVDAAIARIPVLRRDYVAHAIYEPHSMDVDVHSLHEGFLRGARKAGARIVTNAPVTAIGRDGADWRVETGAGSYRAARVVNAAGARADEIATMAGVAPVGLVPKRRTAFNIPGPAGMDFQDWPLLNDVGAEFYFKVTGGQIMVSPADETPSPPMDAWPDDMDVAIGAHRLEQATTLQVSRVTHSWAGLRTFAADGSPVVGEAPDAGGFFWLAGQGGYGIKTSPALSRLCAAQVRAEPFPDDLTALGLSAGDLSPRRFQPRDPTLQQ
ncbi:FAD-dependent catabolic D-arginine dehydrogenase DauA [Rhodobacter sp.]